jgi:hypothetical protein
MAIRGKVQLQLQREWDHKTTDHKTMDHQDREEGRGRERPNAEGVAYRGKGP